MGIIVDRIVEFLHHGEGPPWDAPEDLIRDVRARWPYVSDEQILAGVNEAERRGAILYWDGRP
jgi:hypothetical protein